MEEWEKWSSIIRSCVVTSKYPLSPYEINRDINMLEGSSIPYQKFNYRTLDEMLQKVSGLKVTKIQGKTLIQAIPSEETAHISKMVKLQKCSKKKPRTLPPVFHKKSSYYNVFNTNQNSTSHNKYNSQNKYNSYHKSELNNSTNLWDFSKKPQTSSASYQGSFNTPLISNSSQNKEQKIDKMKKMPSSSKTMSGSEPKPSSLPPSSASQRLNNSQIPHNSQSNSHTTEVHNRNRPPLIPTLETVTLKEPSPVLPRLGVSKTPQSSSNAQKPNMTPGSTSQIPHFSTSMTDPRLRLNSYTESQNLSLPIYKDLPMKNNFIYSLVTVNSKKYSSYPKEAKTKEQAEKLAAQVALDDLLDKENKPRVTTVDRDLIKTRVLKIINNYPNGLFESSVVEYYTKIYNEGLPENWIKLVEQLITLDIGANNLTILSPQSNLQVYKPTSPIISEPEILRLNNIEEFWLHIYVVYNITDIWGIIIDENHSDKIDELAKDMKSFYNTNQSEIPQVSNGKHYAVFDSEWHRVRCIKIDTSKQTATVFFIDRGDEDVFPVDRLRTLHPKFCEVPGQAVRISMAGLETFQDCNEIQTILEELLVDKDVYVRNMKYDPNYPNMLTALLYLETNDNEVNVNEMIKFEIMKKVFDPTIYIQSNKRAQDVFISYVNEKSVFIQLKSKGLTYLKMLMNNLVKEYLNNSHYTPRTILKFDTTKIYVVKNIDDNNWYRVKITKFENENEAQVFYIDEGNTLTVKKSNLILLEDLSELLILCPNQAVQVRLHKISPIMFDQKMAKHLRELAPRTDVFYMKVIDKVEDVPMVEFYKRTEDNYLASLNDTLALEPEITSKDDNNNAKLRARNDQSSINLHSQFPLKSPSIPSVGSFFDVYIVMAAHPGNFTVQPLDSIHKLEKLMTDLLKVCESYTGPPITPGSVKVGSMYAAKYDDDGRWYRAYVSKVISKNICAIYFCDYGDYRAVSLEQLKPLPNQFYDLPYQAIKAKLYGVTPRLKGDWTVKDSLRFNDLVVAKTFVSIIKSCDMSNIESGETILDLELVDTSTVEDIYISNILVDEKRAEKLKAS